MTNISDPVAFNNISPNQFRKQQTNNKIIDPNLMMLDPYNMRPTGPGPGGNMILQQHNDPYWQSTSQQQIPVPSHPLLQQQPSSSSYTPHSSTPPPPHSSSTLPRYVSPLSSHNNNNQFIDPNLVIPSNQLQQQVHLMQQQQNSMPLMNMLPITDSQKLNNDSKLNIILFKLFIFVIPHFYFL